ncbi:MAG: cytochrome c peroxidase [Bacteroidota bacterium]
MLFCLLQACERQKADNTFPKKLVVNVGINIADTVPFPKRNPFSEEGVLLGRMLFYDPVLSANNQISCATCHQQSLAFTDGLALSDKGATSKPLFRHVPALINLAWNDGLFWDGGAKNIESLAFAPLTHPDEMAQDIIELIKELETRLDYKTRFKKVFGKDTIHSAFIVRALAQFQRTLISDNAKYDQFMRKENGVVFSELELKGMQLFEQKCSACHSGQFFTDFSYHNNGLDATFPTEPEHMGQGRARVTLAPDDLGRFKTPTLRNVMLTTPYMHDGRFKTIEEVLAHYDENTVYSETLDTLLINEEQRLGIPLSETEKRAIEAFLYTLTDYEFISDTTLSNPFSSF